MPRYRPTTAILATALLLVSCAKTGVETVSDNASTAEIAATGSRIKSADAAARSESNDVIVTGSSSAYPSAPPPPPPPSVVAPSPLMMTRTAPAPWQSVAPPYHDTGRDKFTTVAQNPFRRVREEPVSTFSIDVDTAP